MKSLLSILAIATLALTGCTIVPKTTFTAQIGGQKFSYSNPKQAIATNIVCEISTNGTARMSIGGISSVNDPVVIDKAYAGQAAVINALGTQLNNAMQSGAALIGTAAKAP